jgi:DNA-binding MarR family transcriptional regulator
VLTEEGRAKLREASTSHIAQIDALFGEAFDEHELASVGDLLERLAAGKSDACMPDD